VMTVASFTGLLIPATREGSAGAVMAGVAAGVLFVAAARSFLGHRHAHFDAGTRRAILVFAVLFVHSLPEGFAIGSAYASTTAGLGTFVLLAIALQNIPEGTAVAVPMEQLGYSPMRQIGAAIGTSLPQPVGAVAAYALVEEVNGLLA